MSDPSDDLRRLLVSRYRFGSNMVDIAWRAHFKCEYCDKDLLGSVDTYEWHWEREHVVPTKHGGEDALHNWALACRTCNQFKGVWDPRSDAVDPLDRDALVASARAYIQRRRAERGAELDIVRGLIYAELNQ